jgi:hypothetical protein
MSGPQNVNPRAAAFGSLEDIERQIDAKGWDFFERQFTPANISKQFEPDDDLKIHLAALAQTELGRRLFDWLLDLTCRAPYPFTVEDRDTLAFAAAKHQARAAIGETIVKAIADGRKLLNAKHGAQS